MKLHLILCMSPFFFFFFFLYSVSNTSLLGCLTKDECSTNTKPQAIMSFRLGYIQAIVLGLVLLSVCWTIVIRPDPSSAIDLASPVTIDLENSLTNLKSFPISSRRISSNIDHVFQTGCRNVFKNKKKANAALVVLARNSELEGVQKSMFSMERHFNQWFNYPWIFLNDEEFTESFKDGVMNMTSSGVSFGVISKPDWNFSEEKDRGSTEFLRFNEFIQNQGDRGIMYGALPSYHKMCRFYSGYFFKHPLVAKLSWYWRVEPDVEFFCDLTYDPFLEMEASGKKYGFAVIIKELSNTVPNLFRHTQSFIEKYGISVDEKAWSIFTNRRSFGEKESMKLIDKIRINHLLSNFSGGIGTRLLSSLSRMNLPTSFSSKKPFFYGEEYNLCHFWSNFEIASTDLFSSPEYESYFQFLEEKKGFYQERWGDAPVHSLAVAMFLNISEIHYFRDIGYRHSNLVHCPKNAPDELQLPYVPASPEYASSAKPDKPPRVSVRDVFRSGRQTEGVNNLNRGSGCRCNCPKKYKELEDSPSCCIGRWMVLTNDKYKGEKYLDKYSMAEEVKQTLSKGEKLNVKEILKRHHKYPT